MNTFFLNWLCITNDQVLGKAARYLNENVVYQPLRKGKVLTNAAISMLTSEPECELRQTFMKLLLLY